MVGFEERVFSTAKSQHGFFKKKTISQIKSQSEMETNGVPTHSGMKNEKSKHQYDSFCNIILYLY